MLMRRIARPLLAAPFVVEGVSACMDPGPRLKAADALLQRGRGRLPDTAAGMLNVDPGTLVRVNGGAQILAGTLLAFGKAPRSAAFVLAVSVIPTAVTEQDFWAEPDPDRKAAKRIVFLKDAGLLGGLLIASGDTQGRPSLGWRGRHAAREARATVEAALPIRASAGSSDPVRERAHDAVEQVRALSATAATRGAELAAAAQVRGGEIADTAKEHSGDIADTVRRSGREWAELIRRRVADRFEER